MTCTKLPHRSTRRKVLVGACAALVLLPPHQPRANFSQLRNGNVARREVLSLASFSSAMGGLGEATHASGAEMRRAVIRKYGDMSDTRVLEFERVPIPVPQEDEVMLRVQAVGLNPIDFKIAAGNLAAIAPLPVYPGTDCSGIVEAVGANVTNFRVGDKVMGNGFGFLGEFAVAKEEKLARKPDAWPFEKAAALPTVGLTAQVLLDASPGIAANDVVIVGAAGGVGTLAVQLAKIAGARKVYAVCSGKNADFVKTLGADEVLDYTQADWTLRFRGGRGSAAPPAYVWDVSPAGGQSVWQSVKDWLPASSTFVSINFLDPSFKMEPASLLNQFIVLPNLNRVQSALGREAVYKFVDATQIGNFREALERLGGAADQGRLDIPSIESYAFNDVCGAVSKLMSGHVRGKVVVTL